MSGGGGNLVAKSRPALWLSVPPLSSCDESGVTWPDVPSVVADRFWSRGLGAKGSPKIGGEKGADSALTCSSPGPRGALGS